VNDSHSDNIIGENAIELSTLFQPVAPADDEQQRQPLVDGQSYYRSKFFHINADINPLIGAASPLLSIMTRFEQLTTAPELVELHQDLSHEIKAFEHKAQSGSYRANTILAARYILCTAVDEALTTTPWGKEGWKQYSLLNAFQREQWGGERFFFILERSKEDPNLHIDLLELIYICLRLGYQGKFRQADQDPQQLGDIADNLYQCIRHQRGEFSKTLCVSAQNSVTTQRKKSWHPPMWVVCSVGIVLLITVYTLFNIQLNTQIKPVTHALMNSQPS